MHHHLYRLLPLLLLLAAGGPAAFAQEVAADSLMLTWERDPTTTMTVRWLQRQPEPALVDGGRAAVAALALPHVGTQEADAAAAGWWDRGLVIDFLLDPKSQLPDPADISAQVRMAWNDEGLLFAARVRDDVAREENDPKKLYLGDSLELFVADAVGSSNFHQIILAPGIGPAHREPRHHFARISEDDARIRTTARPLEDGYLVESLLPWANLKDFTPGIDATLAFQFYINDRDEANAVTRLIWYPGIDAHANSKVLHPLRLAAAADAPLRARVESAGPGSGAVRVLADAALNGQDVRVLAGGRELAVGKLTVQNNRAEAVIALPQPPEDRQWGAVEVMLGEERLGGIVIPASYYRTPEPVTLRCWPADGEEAAARAIAMEVRPVALWPGRFLQHLTLEGLDPDRGYRFRCSNDERVYSFRTLPARQERTLRFAIGGDTMHTPEWMDRMTRVAMEHDPELDAMIWGGDFAYADGSPDKAQRWDTWFEIVHRRLVTADGRVVPLIGCIGNHEVQRGYYHQHPDYEQTDAWRVRIAPFFYQFFPFPGQPGYGVLDIGDYMSLIMLDSAHSNPIEGAQTTWLAATLAERRGVAHVLPIWHVPAYPSVRPFDGRDSLSIREQWLPLLEEHGIRLAFEHHDHAYKRTHPIRAGAVHPDGIVLMGDGAWGVGTRKVRPADETWYLARSAAVRHAILMTVDGMSRQLRVISEDGELVDEHVSHAAPRQP